jgi:hypothetical protein
VLATVRASPREDRQAQDDGERWRIPALVHRPERRHAGDRLVRGWVKGKQILVASASVVFHAAGKAIVKLKLTAADRKLFRNSRA